MATATAKSIKGITTSGGRTSAKRLRMVRGSPYLLKSPCQSRVPRCWGFLRLGRQHYNAGGAEDRNRIGLIDMRLCGDVKNQWLVSGLILFAIACDCLFARELSQGDRPANAATQAVHDEAERILKSI